MLPTIVNNNNNNNNNYHSNKHGCGVDGQSVNGTECSWNIPWHLRLYIIHVRDLAHNNLLKVDRVNPHVLYFTEHHMVKSNLCLINLENYFLGSNFSHSICQNVVSVFLL